MSPIYTLMYREILELQRNTMLSRSTNLANPSRLKQHAPGSHAATPRNALPLPAEGTSPIEKTRSTHDLPPRLARVLTATGRARRPVPVVIRHSQPDRFPLPPPRGPDDSPAGRVRCRRRNQPPLRPRRARVKQRRKQRGAPHASRHGRLQRPPRRVRLTRERPTFSC